jgi:glycosyltransferase involved in cell wall biosynthesis
MKILLITYPVSPYRGSEFSVSWNYIVNMSREHELFVLYGTSGGGLGNVSELKGWLKTHTLNNVHFIDVQMPDNVLSRVLARLRAFNYKFGSFFQYKYWHKQVYRKALEIVGTDGIDIVHYLNPIGFKEPSECWRIKGVPYVWGPVQGVENRPLCLYKALGISGCVDALIRLVVHNGMLLFSPKIRKAVKRADCMFAATPNTVKQMKRVFGKETIYLPENGIQKMNRTEPITYNEGDVLRIVWCGAVVYRKGLILLLDALSKVKSDRWCLNVIGGGNLLPSLKKYADKHNISKHITWHGSIPREQVFKLMSDSHLHVISSLGDATTTVLLEAMSFVVPTMTLDHCGMAGVVCQKCGIKIQIHSYKQVVNDMAANIEGIINEPEKINRLSKGVIECSKKYLWTNRISVFDKAYETAVQKYSYNSF